MNKKQWDGFSHLKDFGSGDCYKAEQLRGADFHLIPEQLAWKNKSLTHLKCSIIITKYSSTCYLHLASTGRNQSTVWSNDLPKSSRTNSIADLFIEPGVPARGPSIHLRSLAVSLLSESLLNYKWGGRKTARVNILSRSSDCPQGLPPSFIY